MEEIKLDVAIIGGGLIGMSSAYMLSKAGLDVQILDKSYLGRESSWAGGGILTPLYPWRYPNEVNALAKRSQQLYPNFISNLQSLTDVDPEYYPSGMLIPEHEIDETACQWLIDRNICFESVSEQSQVLKNISNEMSYTFLPQIHQVRNPSFIMALKAGLCALGVKIHENKAVFDIAELKDGFSIMCETTRFIAKRIVIAAGAWSGSIFSLLNIELPVRPIRGQMLLYKTEPGLIKPIILSEGKYIIPRKDGRILVGSTMEDVGFNKQTTDTARNDLHSFIQRHTPAILKYPLEKTWAGLRPGSPNGIPFIGQHPDKPNLYFNCGHFRNGVVLSLASAELLRDIMQNETTKVSANHYQINGFERECI